MLLLLGLYLLGQWPGLELIGVAWPYLVDQLNQLVHVFARDCRASCAPELAVGSAASAGVLVLASISAAAALATKWGLAPDEQPLAFGVAALALMTVPAALLAGLGWLRPPVGPVLAATPAVAVGVVCLRRGWRPQLLRASRRRVTAPGAVLGVLAASLGLASVALGLLYPPTGYDALAFLAPMGAFFWRDGDLTTLLARAPGYWPLAHPGTPQLWFGALLLLGGERLADFGQLPFALLGAAGVQVFARRLGVRRRAAGLAAAAFLLSPLVVAQARMQLDDVIGAALLITAAALAAAPEATWDAKRLGLLGLTLGLLVTSRLSQLPGAIAIAVFAIGLLARARRSGWRGSLAAWAAAFALVVAPWWLRDIALFGNPLYPAALPVFGHGIAQTDFPPKDLEFVPAAGLAAWMLYPFVEPANEVSGFGALLAVGALPGVVIGVARARRQPLCIYGLTAGLMLPAWWWLTQHEPRFLLGLAGLTLAFTPWCLVAVRRPWRRLAMAILLVTAACSWVFTMRGVVLVNLFEPNARSAFYDRDWAVDQQVAALPESDGLVLDAGYAGIDYATYYGLLGPTRSRTVVVMITGTADEIVARMRETGIRYVYVVTTPASQAAAEAILGRPPFVLQLRSQAALGAQREPIQRSLYRLDETSATARPGISPRPEQARPRPA